jgi:hypothetical protein
MAYQRYYGLCRAIRPHYPSSQAKHTTTIIIPSRISEGTPQSYQHTVLCDRTATASKAYLLGPAHNEHNEQKYDQIPSTSIGSTETKKQQKQKWQKKIKQEAPITKRIPLH